MKCPSCANEIDESLFPAGLVFCPYCGTKLPAGGQDQDRISFCPYCGQKLDSPANFCPHCGQQLVAAGPAPPAKHEGKEFIVRTAGALKRTFGHERKVRKLYRQWAEYADLPPEEIPKIEQTAIGTPSVEEGTKQDFRLLYLVLGAAVLFFIVGVVLLIVQC